MVTHKENVYRIYTEGNMGSKTFHYKKKNQLTSKGESNEDMRDKRL